MHVCEDAGACVWRSGRNGDGFNANATACCRKDGWRWASASLLVCRTLAALDNQGRSLPQTTQLAAEQDGVRYNTSQALVHLVRDGISDGMLTTSTQATDARAGRHKPPALQSIIAAVASSISPRYQESWDMALPGKSRAVVLWERLKHYWHEFCPVCGCNTAAVDCTNQA